MYIRNCTSQDNNNIMREIIFVVISYHHSKLHHRNAQCKALELHVYNAETYSFIELCWTLS